MSRFYFNGARGLLIVGVVPLLCAQGAMDAATSAPALDWRTVTVELPAEAAGTQPIGAVRSLGELPIWPRWDEPTVVWLSILGILAATLRFRGGEWPRAMDGVVLALLCIALLLRRLPAADLAADGHAWRWWGFLLLSAGAAYWVLRGLLVAGGRAPLRYLEGSGAALVLLVAGALLAWNTLRSGPISRGGIDTFAGAMHVLDQGQLPYGALPGRDSRSPLVYLTAAGYSQALGRVILPAEAGGTGTTSRGTIEVGVDDPVRYSDATLRSLHTVLTLAIVVGLLLIGHSLHSLTMGLSIAAVFLLFPGTLEALHDTPTLLAAALMTWAVAFWFVPMVGSLFSAIAVVLAGFVWPWSWLALPIIMAFSIRRGWSFIGAFLGALVGLAIIGATLTSFVRPTLPRYDGMMRVGGLTPRYMAELRAAPATLVITPAAEESQAPSHLLMPLAQWLLRQESIHIANAFERPGAQRIELPEGVAAASIQYGEIKPQDEPTYDLLQAEYRYDVAAAPERVRFAAALRTILESTWKPRTDPFAFETSAWSAWGAFDPEGPVAFDYLRRAFKIVAIVLSLFLAVLILIRREVHMSAMAGAIAAASAMALLASAAGAGANWVWLLPSVLAAHAASKTLTLPSNFAVEPLRAPVPPGPFYSTPGAYAGAVPKPAPPPMRR